MRGIAKTLLLLFFVPGSAIILMAQYEIPNHSDPAKPFPWPEGKRCAVSLTFDDARPSQIDKGIPLLNQYGVKATFYLSPGNLEKRLEGWKAAAAQGHEIGNHTMSHPCSGNFAFARDNPLEEFTLDRIAKEMDDANRVLFEKLRIQPVSFAYPCGQKFVGRGVNLKSYVPVVAQKFLTGRGWLDEDSNDPWFCDLAHLMGMESDRRTFEELKQWVDKAAAHGRWLVLAGHDIGESGHQTTRISALEPLCRYAQDPANGIWIAPVAAVAEYIQQAREGLRTP